MKTQLLQTIIYNDYYIVNNSHFHEMFWEILKKIFDASIVIIKCFLYRNCRQDHLEVCYVFSEQGCFLKLEKHFHQGNSPE